MSTDTQLAKSEPKSVRDYLALPAYKSRFEEVLKQRAPQFMAAITQVSQLPGLKDAEPRSVIAAAMTAASLDLPINPTLGMAYILAYKDRDGRSVAQFQAGYKAFIQLALRSGQYKRLNAGPVSAGAFKGYDMVGEPILDFTQNDPTAESAGYYCAFETLNGFQKVVYWTRAQCEAHAKRFSKAYAKGWTTPWSSDFDAMATKTVIKAALTKWGILSVEMQRAAIHDQGIQSDVDAEVKYVDGEDKDAERVEGDPAPERPAPPKRAAKGAAAVKENVRATPPEIVVPAEEVVATPPPAPAVESFADAAKATDASKAVTAKTSLTENEIVALTCTVKSVTAAVSYPAGKPEFGVVVAQVAGEYVGEVTDLKGAKITKPAVRNGADVTEPAVAEASPPWIAGYTVKLTLRGAMSKKTGTVKALVDAVEVVAEES